MGIYHDLSEQLKNTYATIPMGDAYSLWFKKDGTWKNPPTTISCIEVCKQVGKEVEKDYQIIHRIENTIGRYLRGRK
jgi:hypothetical protein